jgi:hypothetical protein
VRTSSEVEDRDKERDERDEREEDTVCDRRGKLCARSPGYWRRPSTYAKRHVSGHGELLSPRRANSPAYSSTGSAIVKATWFCSTLAS